MSLIHVREVTLTWGSHCSVCSDEVSSLYICGTHKNSSSVVGAGLVQNKVGKPIYFHTGWSIQYISKGLEVKWAKLST